MKGYNLGEFEELVLLCVASQQGEAYGLSVCQQLNDFLGREVSLSGVHTALYRLEDKGHVKAEMSEPTEVRGGRRKKLFRVTSAGLEALGEARSMREQLYRKIPDWKWKPSVFGSVYDLGYE